MHNKELKSKKVKKIFLCGNTNTAKRIIRYLSKKYGFSRVSKTLTIYYENGLVLSCNVKEIKIKHKLIRPKKGQSYITSYIVQPSYLGSIIQTFAQIGIVRGHISCVSNIIFPEVGNVKIVYKRNTLISKHYFKVIYKRENCEFDFVVSKMIRESLTGSEINTKIKNLNKEAVVDELGVPNKKIIEFCNKNNLSWGLSSAVNYFHAISAISNDYSDAEDDFEMITGQPMNSRSPTPLINTIFFKKVSIVIPCYNTGNSILKTLKSIDRQAPKLNFQVIIVDDASKIPVIETIKKANLKLSFTPLIIRNEVNCGSSNSRNIGASIAKNDILIFLDSDVVLTTNYIYEHVIRHMVMSKSVCVSFKENVDPHDKRITFEAIKKGVTLPKYENDLRLTKYQNKYSLGYYKDVFLNNKGSVFSILADSDYFKKMGYGRKFGVFDLPSMVISHNISVRFLCYKTVGGFEKSLSGYGLEDAQFGIKMIANGAYVVPILNCGVYHINHKTRRGKEEKLRQEFLINSKKVNNYLFKKIKIDES